MTAKTEQPDCVAVPITNLITGEKVADSLYLRLWIENIGNAPAQNAEVYAQELRRRRVDGQWEVVAAFPPMNLKWSNLPFMNYPVIAPQMGKHCDCAHIVDPAHRNEAGLSDDNPTLDLNANTASLTFDLIATPNHRGNIVGPGTYRLLIKVAASNAPPSDWLVELRLDGAWDMNAGRMMADHVGISVTAR